MEEILNEVLEIKGVTGIFLANRNGNIVSRVGYFETIPVKNVLTEIETFLQQQLALEQLPEWIQFVYDNQFLILQPHLEILVVCLCRLDAPISMLRLTLGVMISKITMDKKRMKKITG